MVGTSTIAGFSCTAECTFLLMCHLIPRSQFVSLFRLMFVLKYSVILCFPELCVNEVKLAYVKSFKYLGHIIADNNTQREIANSLCLFTQILIFSGVSLCKI